MPEKKHSVLINLVRFYLIYKHRSSQNNLGTNQSDVDICISTSWNGLRCIKTLANVLRKSKCDGDLPPINSCRIYCPCVQIDGLQIVRTIPRAKVPIVKIWDPVL